MTYELTKDGLFGYFGSEIIEKIIELPLIKRHLSAHDYCQSKDYLSRPQNNSKPLQKKHTKPLDAILSLDVLQQAPMNEVIQYLSIEKIKEAYMLCYGDYFLLFQEKFLTAQEHPPLSMVNYLPLLDLVGERKLILSIQGAMAIPLQAYTHAILEQDFLLQEIASQLIYQSGKAQKFIDIIQEDDSKYKQLVVNLAFSVVKMGFGVFNAGELIHVSNALVTLAAGTFDNMEEKLSSLVSDIQHLVMNTHLWVLQEAEKELLSTTGPEEITLRWSMYRFHIFHSASQSIKRILDSCVNNDNFFRCVIRETISQHEGLTQEILLIHAIDKAQEYVAYIMKGLQSQVGKIRRIRDAVISPEGSQNIEIYFRKICLINYTMHHEKSGTFIERWLTKKLGHRLSFYFPDVVFQKKWSSAKLHHIFYHEVEYSKQKLTLAEYQERKKKSPVVLGLFRNSSRVKRALFANLEEQIPYLGDRLVCELQQQGIQSRSEDVFLSENTDSDEVSRYSFSRRKLSLFSFCEPNPEEMAAKSIQKVDAAVVLISRRDLES